MSGAVVARAVIALGANLGDSAATLRDAAAAIVRVPGITGVASSHPVESVAVTLDGPDAAKPRYRNGIVVVDTELTPEGLLTALQHIEDAFGRVRLERWGDRTLDLDVVAYGDARIDTDRLTVPHPRAAERAFVLAPWLDADPDAVLPGLGTVRTLLAAIGDDTARVPEPRLLDGAAPALPGDTSATADAGAQAPSVQTR